MSTLAFLNNLKAPPRQVMDLPLDQVHPDPDQPRKSLQAVDGMVDPAAQEALEELAEDIADQGLHQPITVREVEPERYLIVMGERRWRAFKLNQSRGVPNSDVIPALIRQDLSAARLRLSQLSENLQRSDLSDIEVASFLKAILEEYPDLQKQELAKLLKRNNQWISRILALLDPRWSHVVNAGIISYASLLEQFKALPEHKQTELVSRAQTENRPLTSGDMKQARQEAREEKNGKGLVPPTIPTVGSANEAFQRLGIDRDPNTVDMLAGRADSEVPAPAGGLTPDLADMVQDLINSHAPKDEAYTPPANVSPAPLESRIRDFGGDAVMPPGPQSLNVGLLEKREAKLTLEQLERLLSIGALANKSHVVTVMLPVEEIKEAIAVMGGEQPEDDSLLMMGLVNQLNAL